MHLKFFMSLIALGTLSGCVSSFQARPSPILTLKDTTDMIDNYGQDTAILKFHSSNAADRQNLDQKSYRNLVISLYLSAIDARYDNFVTAVSTQNKGADLFFGTAALGLSSAATLTKKTAANILSAGAAFATGTQSSVNQKLYFDRTFPALLASMDASRKEVKATIIRKMASPASDYPIEVSFADLYDYQSSASLDEAVQRITVNAGNDARRASDEVAKARVDVKTISDNNQSVTGSNQTGGEVGETPATPVAPATASPVAQSPIQ